MTTKTITIEIPAEALIAKLAQHLVGAYAPFCPWPAAQPTKIGDLWPGTTSFYAGLVRGEDGAPDHHLVLLDTPQFGPGDWHAAKAWAASLGAALPTRREQSILYANLRERFEDAWYWSGEEVAGYADYAWLQTFGNGDQNDNHKSYQYRARVVRRAPIQSFTDSPIRHHAN